MRGIAITLVLFRHQFLFSFTEKMGWIGVDLFFVLSGFLVSGLLFKEYLRFGYIQPKRFLIRRGFKIYPIYYIFYLVYLIPMIIDHNYNFRFILSDLTFIQNYVHGWGYAYAASWSLAVEEHFYFGFAILLWISLRKNFVKLKVESDVKGPGRVEVFIFSTMVLCLIFRVLSNLTAYNYARNFTMTHLRIDSLLAGVLISYLYYFRLNYLKEIYTKNRLLLFLIAIFGLSWTPFIEAETSYFAKTIGFTLLYISFGIVLLTFLLSSDINRVLNKVFSKSLVDVFSKIGFCSYSIYIIHTFVNLTVSKIQANFHFYYNPFLYFILTSFMSITIGMIMTYYIERYFLKTRDRYYPSRVV